MTNFGGKPNKSKIDNVTSYQTVILITLFSGVFIWAAYRGCLTSELAFKNVKYPFQDLHSFSKSNYR